MWRGENSMTQGPHEAAEDGLGRVRALCSGLSKLPAHFIMEETALPVVDIIARSSMKAYEMPKHRGGKGTG